MAECTTMRLLCAILLSANIVVAQSAPPRKDIPTIAKAANGSIVSIVMSDKNGKPIAQGTGFVVSKDGLIVTNYHVVAEGSSAVAKLPDGAIFILEGVVASDKARDVAVVKASGKNFRTLMLGNSDRVEVGQGIVAIGNPLSLESTVSNGIVSGIRTAEELGGKFLQVTAPISPGSSGGPLFNMAGEVIGITTLYLKEGENLNFAIPINDAKRLLVDPCAGITPPPGLVLDRQLSGCHKTVQAWPNETQPIEGHAQEKRPPESDPRPMAAPQMNSPAYQSYLELLKSGDTAFRVSTYACFDDDPTSKTFMVIDATLLDKRSMSVTTQDFTSGVSKVGGIFSGELTSFSNADNLFGTLYTMYDNKGNPSHQTDAFEWAPDVLSVKAGFGKLLPGQVRLTYEFKMQRSTGRYTEKTVFAGAASDGFTINKTGKCIRIPNTRTPEEMLQSLSGK
jgi:hypothetical protein